MEHKQQDVYFSNEALARFASAQGKTVGKIICHLWQNAMNKNELVEVIDNIEIHFTDGNKLTIACNEKGDGLDAIVFNYKQTAVEMEAEFDGKIKLLAIDASSTKMWQDVIGKKLIAVQLTKESDYYRADSVMLAFEEEKRVIFVNPLDGIIIDYYEE
jgi:hypothetical protein